MDMEILCRRLFRDLSSGNGGSRNATGACEIIWCRPWMKWLIWSTLVLRRQPHGDRLWT